LAIEKKLPLIIAGDLFHWKKVTNEERHLADRWLGSIESNKIPCILTYGNHDHLYNGVSLIDGYKHMPFKYVKVVTKEPELIVWGDTTLLAASWADYTQEQIKELVQRFLPIMNTKYKVVILHECIVGSEFDNGILAKLGTRLPDIPEITYWAVGDIHTSQRASLDNAWYAGSPLQFGFKDKLNKGILEIDLTKPTKAKFHPLNFKKLKTVSSVDEIKDDAFYKVKGEIKDVLEANRHSQVLRADFNKSSHKAITLPKMEITDKLTEFLAERGIDGNGQKEAVEWVKKILEERRA
jgi:DNA repair exonuclease SbcCD nuclease subunit